MSTLIAMMAMGFFCGLKTSGIKHPESNRINTWVGYAICILILLMQFLLLGSGRGEIFWIVFALISASVLLFTRSLFGSHMETLDVLSIIMFTLSLVVMRISALTIFTGIALITLFYPMSNTYVMGNNFLKFDRMTIIRIVVVFGLVVFWFGANESITSDLITIISWLIDI